MIRRIVSVILQKRAKSVLDNVGMFKSSAKELFERKGSFAVAIVGAPGSGKTTFVKYLRRNDRFFGFDWSKVKIIDDLKDENGKMFKVSEIKNILKKNKLALILSDYRAAVYLKGLIDILIFIKIDENKRLKNLNNRKSKKRFYRLRIYSYPPVPLRYLFGFKDIRIYYIDSEIVYKAAEVMV